MMADFEHIPGVCAMSKPYQRSRHSFGVEIGCTVDVALHRSLETIVAIVAY